jgi:hypothetical protein
MRSAGWKIWGIGAVALLGTGFWLAYSLPPREPVYQGKALTAWLE